MIQLHQTRRLRVVLDGRVVEGTIGRLDGRSAWINATTVASRWGARLDIGEDILGWHDPRTGRTVVFRRGRPEVELGGQGAPVALSAPPDWSDGVLRFPADAVALAGGATLSVDTRACALFLTRPDPYLAAWRILIDPGHGGQDSGASYPGLLEKDLNLDVARRLGRLLKDAGAAVALTRRTDADLNPAERCRRARQFQAGLVVSIHHAAVLDGKAGAEAYFCRGDESRRLAASLAGALARGLELGTRGAREASVGILNCLDCPAALAEIVLPSRSDAARPLLHAWNRTREALALLEGLRAFCSAQRGDGAVWGYPSP